MDLCEIGSPSFGQAAQHPKDRTSCNHREPTSSGTGFLALSCFVCGEWSIESGEPFGFGRISYLATGGIPLPFPLLA